MFGNFTTYVAGGLPLCKGPGVLGFSLQTAGSLGGSKFWQGQDILVTP